MSFPIIILVVVLTAIISALFIILINHKFIKDGLNGLSFKNVVTQLVLLTAWITVLGNTLLPIHPENIISSVIVFSTSVIIGMLLIYNLSKEVETESNVKKLINKLHENNERLKELDKQKTEFVSLASHQLRGPLTVIQGYVSMILEGDYGDITPTIKEQLEKVQKSGNTLGFLINDYLDVSKIDKGEMEYIIEDLNFTRLVKDLSAEFAVIAGKSGINLELQNEIENDVFIRADKTKTRQIISNLIDNAIKYTPKGSVILKLVKIKNDVKFSVVDSGIGINKSDLNTIFGKFQRRKEAMELNVTGTGLGLFVAKVMTESQGGKIWAESDGIGKGSIFNVEFPIFK